MKSLYTLIFAVSCCFFSCSNNQENKQTENSNELAPAEGKREAKEDEIHEYGLIKNIDQGIYPMYNVYFEFPERRIKKGFTLNIETLPQTAEDINSKIGKYVTFYYTSNLTPSIMAIEHNGSLINTNLELDPTWNKVKGTLTGADAITPGDLPDNIAILEKGGVLHLFETYIDQELTNLNDKEVILYYYNREENKITYIESTL